MEKINEPAHDKKDVMSCQSSILATDMRVCPKLFLRSLLHICDSKGSDETVLMRNLARAFPVCLCNTLFSCAGSINFCSSFSECKQIP